MLFVDSKCVKNIFIDDVIIHIFKFAPHMKFVLLFCE